MQEKIKRMEMIMSFEDDMRSLAKKINEDLIGEHDIVPSPGGGVQRHPRGLVGFMWRIKTPETVRIGNCFMNGRLKTGDLWLCFKHGGDCYQDYMFVEEHDNCFISRPEIRFGSYGIGDAERIDIDPSEFEILKLGGRVERKAK